MDISQLIGNLNSIKEAHGDIVVELEVNFQLATIQGVAQGSAKSVSLMVEEGESNKKCLISSDVLGV